jgi:hypothetical protein
VVVASLCASTFCSRFVAIELGHDNNKLLHLLFVTSLQLCNIQTQAFKLWQQPIFALAFCLESNLCATFFCLRFATIRLGHGSSKFVRLFSFAGLQLCNNWI